MPYKICLYSIPKQHLSCLLYFTKEKHVESTFTYKHVYVPNIIPCFILHDLQLYQNKQKYIFMNVSYGVTLAIVPPLQANVERAGTARYAEGIPSRRLEESECLCVMYTCINCTRRYFSTDTQVCLYDILMICIHDVVILLCCSRLWWRISAGTTLGHKRKPRLAS